MRFEDMMDPAPTRILSAAECDALEQRIRAMAVGGGTTSIAVDSRWRANIRWANNTITTGGDTQDTVVTVHRSILGASAAAQTNGLDDARLREAVRNAEDKTRFVDQDNSTYPARYEPRYVWDVHPIAQPKIWFDSTYGLETSARARAVAPLMAQANERGLVSAGYVEIGAQGASVIARESKVHRYYPRTMAQFSVTVRDPKRRASGWAGVDFNDWARIDTKALMQIAIDKCERSRDPVAVEPGYFTAVLEPQAVTDLVGQMFMGGGMMSRVSAESFGMGPFVRRKDNTVMLEERVMDERLSLIADPVDPDCGFLPFDWAGEPYLPTTWVDRGVLKTMAYDRWYALLTLLRNFAVPDSLAFHLLWHGPVTSIDEMIASTQRGVLVTRFSAISVLDWNSAQVMGNTRDGLWLIERGKITKPIKNFRFTEPVIAALNRVEQGGTPQRTFRPAAPAVTPPLKIRDFFFGGLMDAI